MMTNMKAIATLEPAQLDLAGYCHPTPKYLQTRARLNYLIERYLSLDILSDRLIDLPSQFANPRQRPWQPIAWREICQEQIVGVEPEFFLGLIAAVVEIELPIRGYSRESWQYFQQAHPQFARFVGGVWDETGNVVEVGIWEKEERQHAPAFRKIYQELTGQKLTPVANTVTGFQPQGDHRTQLYNHAVGRIATEWSAISAYLWLMAHSTGALQQAIAQPLQDEVNHLAKFWGIARWGFGDSAVTRTTQATGALLRLLLHHRGERTHSETVFQGIHPRHLIELGFIFPRVMRQMWRWNAHLQTDALAALFGTPPQRR
ncbi:MAG: hypothetical protein ACPGVO_20690 [Spirulinaceae cyanobacterium]